MIGIIRLEEETRDDWDILTRIAFVHCEMVLNSGSKGPIKNLAIYP